MEGVSLFLLFLLLLLLSLFLDSQGSQSWSWLTTQVFGSKVHLSPTTALFLVADWREMESKEEE